jgi:predicted flavoprotein YhiN
MESKPWKPLFCWRNCKYRCITGGFNFQNAWTSGYIVANAI